MVVLSDAYLLLIVTSENIIAAALGTKARNQPYVTTSWIAVNILCFGSCMFETAIGPLQCGW